MIISNIIFTVSLTKTAQKQLLSLPSKIQSKILPQIRDLGTNPFPTDFKKLTGVNNSYRIRVGKYRVMYTISKKSQTLNVVRVSHRKDVYRP